jgi:3-oxoacyl-[acyl-carrier protein] reductase
MIDFEGRVALVTGASRGIGFAVAEHLRSSGARVLAPTRSDLDLTSGKSIDRFLADLGDPVDVLVNNAGVNKISSYDTVTDEDIEETLKTNLIAPLQLTRGIAPQMVRRSYGRIVNISSIWSVVSKPGRVTYAMSKSGLNGMTRTLAVELAPFGILVNGVAPGFVNTDLTKQNNSEQALQVIRGQIPVGRLAEVEEIAELVAYLCSDRNTYVTGQTILADGGFSIQ